MKKNDIKRKVMKIMDLAIQINDKTPHTIMLQYSGHTKEIGISIFFAGWVEHKIPNYDRRFYLDRENNIAGLDELTTELKKLLPAGKGGKA